MNTAPATDSRQRRLPVTFWLAALLLLLILWASRTTALTSLPLHNDEGLHLTRAIAVWDGHPFWDITDGKIINHWPIALFYPQHTPAFAGRLPTVMISMIGLAAGLALLKQRFNWLAALLGGLFWISAPYLFFYERIAQSDPEAGALVVVTVWAALRLVERQSTQAVRRHALLTGLALVTATLFKLTAAPFALAVLLIVTLAGRITRRQRIEALLIIGVVGAACFAVPMGYLMIKGQGLFEIALGWVGVSGDQARGPVANLRLLWESLTAFGGVFWAMLIIAGLAGLLPYRDTAGRWSGGLLGALVLSLGVIILLSAMIEPRHFVVSLPLMMLLAGTGWAHWLLHLRALPLPGNPAAAGATRVVRRTWFERVSDPRSR